MPRLTEPLGSGTKAAQGLVQGIAGPPSPNMPVNTLQDRLGHLQGLLGLVAPVPAAWLQMAAGASTGHIALTGGQDTPTLALKHCENYRELTKAWRMAMKWSVGLDNTLAVMLASSMSTQFVGEQLWFKIIGPPACGKTSLMEGLATARKWYLSKDTIRGFHTGWRREDGKDTSLAEMVRGMTLGTKDGDTLLKAPNLKQILAEGRALYDRVSRTNYRNDINREYLGHRMTWHLAGTSALREIDDSELGVRFLDIVVMEKIDDAFEDEVGWRAANQEIRNMLHISDGKPESQHPQELAHAMSLTGGYLDFLRTNAQELSNSITIEPECIHRCNRLGKFTAFMRARPNGNEHAEREFSPRLVKQLARLMIAIAAVLGKTVVDEEVMRRVHTVVMHTSRGSTLDLVKTMIGLPQGMEIMGLSALMQVPDDKLRSRLRFLRKIGVMETDIARKRWRVTPKVRRLYEEVING